MESLDLDRLHAFVAVAGEGHVSAAARRLGISQPAATARIRRLEMDLGILLFDRGTRPMALTEAGRLLMARAPRLLAEARSLHNDLAVFGRVGRERLRLGLPDSLAEIMGAEIASTLTGLARRIELKSGTSPWIESAFRDRDVDLAIDSPPFRNRGRGRFDVETLFHDPLLIAIPGSWPRGTLDSVIRERNFVAYSRSSKFGTACSLAMRRLGITSEARFSLDNTQSLLRFVQAGYGWAITSAFCLLQSPSALQDLTIRICPETPPRTLCLLYRDGESEPIARTAAATFRSVFHRLLASPWKRLSPEIARVIRDVNANPDS
ncbi:MAG: LysR family transcriptional regulator [Paracoccaceae bacterium]|nr:LysR family transcriptional regulator [Paracoccaceae bacterium]